MNELILSRVITNNLSWIVEQNDENTMVQFNNLRIKDNSDIKNFYKSTFRKMKGTANNFFSLINTEISHSSLGIFIETNYLLKNLTIKNLTITKS